jgi:hypothetical protein
VKGVARAINNVFDGSEGSLRSPRSTGRDNFEGLSVTAKGYKAHIGQVISTLDKQLQLVLEEEGNERSVNADQSKVRNIAAETVKKVWHFLGLSKGLHVPGPRSQETEGVQPVFIGFFVRSQDTRIKLINARVTDTAHST